VSDGVENTNDWRVQGGYDYFLNEKWFAYGKTQFEHDEFADLELRSGFSVGLGYQFFESPNLNLSVAAGSGYVNEDFIVAEDNSFAAGLWYVNYDQYFFNKIVQLFHRSNGYIGFENSDGWSFFSQQGLRFPI